MSLLAKLHRKRYLFMAFRTPHLPEVSFGVQAIDIALCI